MKTLQLTLVICLSFLATIGLSQDVDVTFRVNMQNQTGITDMNVFGQFSGWDASQNPLTNTSGTIWEGTVTMPAGTYEYKFTSNGNSNEEIFNVGDPCTITTGPFTNRISEFTATTTLDIVCFGECSDCAAPEADVRITSVDPTTGDVTLTNLGNDTQDMTTWFLCNAPSYESVSAYMGVDPLLGPGDDLMLNWASVTGTTGELGLYSSPSNYADPANVADYMEWGSTGNTRSATAVAAGVWNTGDFVTGASPYSFTGGQGDYGSAFWSEFSPIRNITFTVDMSNEPISAMGAHYAGSIQGWDAAANIMTNNNDGTWSITFAMEEGTTYEYQFINGNDFSQQESVPSECGADNGLGGFNRFYTVGATDEVLPTVCFSSCTACPVIPEGCTDPAAQNYDAAAEVDNGSCTYLLTVTVDMSEVTEAFTTPEINGNYNGWCGGCNPLTDNGDGTWTGTFTVPQGQVEYKFAADTWTIQEDLTGITGCVVDFGGNWNRVIDITGDTVVDEVCWGSCFSCDVLSGCTDPAAQNYVPDATVETTCNYLLTVTVNMSEVTEAFTTPEINGNYNGWCGGCNPLTANGDGTWTGTFEVPEGQIEYKFAADTWNIQEDVVGAGSCTLGANRFVQIDGDTTVDAVCWGSCVDCGVLAGCNDPNAQNYDQAASIDDGSCTYLLTVTVNMSEVTEAFTTPEINGNYNGWCGGCNPLTDNGDGTWTGTFTVPQGQVEYKFAADAWTIQEDLTGVTGCVVDFGGNWNRVIQITGDTEVSVVCWGSCDDCAPTAIEGCTDPLFLEFDPYAEVENGSCSILVVEGCAYSDADNFNPNANRDDESCVFSDDSCPGDFNNDDAITITDLSGFLAAFGTICD